MCSVGHRYSCCWVFQIKYLFQAFLRKAVYRLQSIFVIRSKRCNESLYNFCQFFKGKTMKIRCASPAEKTIARGEANAQPICISIKGRKPYPTVNTAFYSVAKWGLPKLECRTAMGEDPEYPIWQRSPRSSPSALTARTWRRGAVFSTQYKRKEGARGIEKSRKCIEQSASAFSAVRLCLRQIVPQSV